MTLPPVTESCRGLYGKLFGHSFRSVFQPFREVTNQREMDGDSYVGECCSRCGCIVTLPDGDDNDEGDWGPVDPSPERQLHTRN